MQINAETKDRIVAERLLSDLATRLNGAIDFWTVVCLGPMPVDRRSFLLENTDRLRSLAVVLGSMVPTSFPESKLQGVFKNMSFECQRLGEAFLVLENLQNAEAQELRSATEAIRQGYDAIRDGITQAVQALGLEPPGALTLNPDRKAYFARILDGLFRMAMAERSQVPPTAALANAVDH
jgi:hypothetical protein